MIHLFNIKDTTEYYIRLRNNLEFTLMRRSLSGKFEYGNRKAKNYITLEVCVAGNIAREHNLNDKLSEILTICRASFFPIFGQECVQLLLNI